MTRFYIIGLDDHPDQFFPAEVKALIQSHRVFSGGLRHHELMAPYLPANNQWIDIKVPLDQVFEQYLPYKEIVVFASGDPLFYGFANTIKKRLPEAEMKIYPTFNSLQMLAHRLQIPYQDMQVASVTGRPWHKLDEALIGNVPMIGVLTDREHTPAAIADRMLAYGLDAYKMYIGEHLGNPEKERVHRSFSLTEIKERTFGFPNCVLLVRTADNKKFGPLLGIPDTLFEHLDGRKKMITKAPIRLLDLSALSLHTCEHFWDIGFCTGSISIEAKRQYPHLHIHAFEIREACRSLMEINSHRLGAPGIEVHIGDFLQEDLTGLPNPDAIFIGGHGGKLKEIVRKISDRLALGGTLVFNAVSDESRKIFLEAIQENDLHLQTSTDIQINSYNPITLFSATKK